jgi:alkanesulfonate monooxygenase SsuD/methylene tetrahydromethanopterin reductase-like flavin-dependent oxidoreductase (luciferase family)
VRQRISFVRAAAGARFPQLEINVRVSPVIVTRVADAMIAKIAALQGVAPPAVAGSPFALIGSPGQLAEKLLGLRERLGISYYAVPAPAADDFAPVVAALRQS